MTGFSSNVTPGREVLGNESDRWVWTHFRVLADTRAGSGDSVMPGDSPLNKGESPMDIPVVEGGREGTVPSL
jgi:hypothetical protein